MVANFRKSKKGTPPGNLFFSLLLAAFLLVAISFLLVTNLRIKSRRVDLTAREQYLKSEIQKLEEKNNELKIKIEEGASREYLEKVAREQLGYKAPGEEVVVISRETKTEPSPAPQQPENFMDVGGWLDWLRGKF